MKEFQAFTGADIRDRTEDYGVIDSAIYEEDGRFYMFVKSEKNPEKIILLVAEQAEGPYVRKEAFDESMEGLESGLYEAPTAVRLEDGRWCLFLDYYGVPGAGQGYVPLVPDSLKSVRFVRSDAAFSFPYGFKHGTILTLTLEAHWPMTSFDLTHQGYL